MNLLNEEANRLQFERDQVAETFIRIDELERNIAEETNLDLRDTYRLTLDSYVNNSWRASGNLMLLEE